MGMKNKFIKLCKGDSMLQETSIRDPNGVFIVFDSILKMRY